MAGLDTSQRDERNQSEQPTRTVAVIASTMRSGSTLLKALLAEAEDISNLPETNFQKFGGDAAARIEALSDCPIVVLKKPAWYQEVSSYPRLPQVDSLKTICLIRDAYPTVRSLRKMTLGRFGDWTPRWATRWLLTSYWARVSEKLIDMAEADPERNLLVRYEDVLAQPREQTGRLFDFLGSKEERGVDSYQPPSNYRWRWGSDDGSERIKSLRVQPPRVEKQRDEALVRLISNLPDVMRLRDRLGYHAPV